MELLAAPRGGAMKRIPHGCIRLDVALNQGRWTIKYDDTRTRRRATRRGSNRISSGRTQTSNAKLRSSVSSGRFHCADVRLKRGRMVYDHERDGYSRNGIDDATLTLGNSRVAAMVAETRAAAAHRPNRWHGRPRGRHRHAALVGRSAAVDTTAGAGAARPCESVIAAAASC
jgi:hypothetical protein